MKSLIHHIICLALVLSFSACEDTVYRSSIPTYPVSFKMNIAGEYVHFVPDNTGNYYTFTEPRYAVDAIGYAGLLICTGHDCAYHAYDLGCPNCVSQSDPLIVNGLFAECPKCGEQYEFYNGIGNPTKGIVKECLRKYQATYNGQTLFIHH